MRTLVLALLVSAPLMAQSVTSPLGLNAVEGNASFSHWGAGRRFQQIDNTLSGTPRVIKSFAVRRNGSTTQSSALAKTLDFTLDLGECDFALLSQDLDANFAPGTRVNAVPQTKVNFPDWTLSIPGPAPFDFVVPFPAPFLYKGKYALVIDFLIQNMSSTSTGSTDRDFTSPAGGSSGTAGSLIGTGCTTTGQSSAFTHGAYFLNQGPLPDPRFALRFRIQGDKAPAGAPVLLFIDIQDQNLAGLACTTIHALPLAVLTLASGSTGKVPDQYFGFPYNAVLEGARLYTQLLALDPGRPGLPVTLSNARATTIPAIGSISTSHPTTYSWYTLPASTTNSVIFGGGMVIELGS